MLLEKSEDISAPGKYMTMAERKKKGSISWQQKGLKSVTVRGAYFHQISETHEDEEKLVPVLGKRGACFRNG